MNTVVSKLLEVDRQARQLLDEARQYYDKTIEEIETEKEKLLADYAEKAALHIADVQGAESAQADDSAARIAQEAGAKIQALEEIWSQSHKQWEDTMFERCVRRVNADA